MDIYIVLIYILEVLKYSAGNYMFFHGRLKRLWLVPVVGVLYFSFVEISNILYDIAMFFSYIVAAVAIFLMMSESVKAKIWRIFCILCVSSTIDAVSGIFLESFISDLRIISACESMITIVVIILLGIIGRKLPYEQFLRKRTIGKILLAAVVCVSCGMTATVTLMQTVYELSPKQVGDARFYFFVIFLYISIIIMVAVAIYIRNTHVRMEEMLQQEREMKEMQKMYYTTLLEKEENTRRYRHDMNNHWLCIKELLNKDDSEQAKVYINQLLKAWEVVTAKQYETGNEILNILLNYHLRSLKNTDISMQGYCSRSIKIEDTDFCIIFSNLVQNAVEELKRREGLQNYFIMNIKQGKDFTSIEVKNSSDYLLKEKKEAFKTKKADTKNHGIGLKNVRKVIEENGGTLMFGTDGKWFTATVILNNH